MKYMLHIMCLCVVVVFMAANAQLKNKTRTQLNENDKMRQTISKLQSDAAMLEAEWAHLNGPLRLAMLVEEHAENLPLMPLAPEQMLTMDRIPFVSKDIVVAVEEFDPNATYAPFPMRDPQADNSQLLSSSWSADRIAEALAQTSNQQTIKPLNGNQNGYGSYLFQISTDRP